MILRFSGIVELGDDSRLADEDDESVQNGAILIGGHDLIMQVAAADFKEKVTIGIKDERYDGVLSVETGWGYSEFTPMDVDALTVGPHNIIEILTRYEGQEVTVFVADEPVNIIEADFTVVEE